jgi:hypothetical protein
MFLHLVARGDAGVPTGCGGVCALGGTGWGATCGFGGELDPLALCPPRKHASKDDEDPCNPFSRAQRAQLSGFLCAGYRVSLFWAMDASPLKSAAQVIAIAISHRFMVQFPAFTPETEHPFDFSGGGPDFNQHRACLHARLDEGLCLAVRLGLASRLAGIEARDRGTQVEVLVVLARRIDSAFD